VRSVIKLHAKLILIFIITGLTDISETILRQRIFFADGGKLANDSAWQDFRNKN